MKARYLKYILDFNRPAGTSRGILTQKETWFIVIDDNGRRGIGECGLLRGLSIDDRPDYETKLQWVCENIELGPEALWKALLEFPSIQFGVETAFESLKHQNPFELFPSEFTIGTQNIPINGLVWMGDAEFMQQQIGEKLSQGYRCVKMKIGAIDFEKELRLLAQIRQNYSADQIEIRLDANGAFTVNEALYKLSQLSEFKIHSIEQPIQKNQYDSMAELCKTSPIPIALDEELIGVFEYNKKEKMLLQIMPQFIILKPSFIGGFRGANEWIALADKYNIGWWVTSALESNIGLNAIAQWTFGLGNTMPQGLGTGGLYTNNFDSPLEIVEGALRYNPAVEWTGAIFDL